MGKNYSKIVKRVQHWQKNFMNNFRMSLSVRISLNYVKFLLINGILFFLVIAFLLFQEDRKPYMRVFNQMTVNLEYSMSGFMDYISDNQPKNITVALWEPTTGKERMLFSNTEMELMDKSYKLDYFLLNRLEDGRLQLLIKEQQPIYFGLEEYRIIFYYDFSATAEKMVSFLRNASLVYLVLILFVIFEIRRDNQKMLKPIQNMTETAKKLTVNNLHSERLYIKGVQNELKDLAEVFNEMLDRLELSYESQKQFVSNASHELRTPIAVIQGYSGMLSRWGASDPDILKESIDSISEEAKAMQELVEKLLFLSRHDKKTLKLNKEEFSMGEVVEDMIKETRMVIKDRNIKTQLVQNVNVYGDPQTLKQAIRIFIDNAVKYSLPGDTITIACENRRGNCIITVADTGIGMKKEDVDHIFDRFFRADDVRDRKIEGHGLGLSIAKLIVLAHAGSIKVRTQYTKGTSFTITFPRQRKGTI